MMKRKLCIPTVLALLVFTVAPTAPAAAAGWESGISVSSALPAQPGFSAPAYQNEALRLINQQRAARSLRPLTATAAMDGIAAVRAEESSVLFSHTRPNGSSPASLFAQNGISYSTAGETLAFGYVSADALVAAWMLSPEHRSNILNANFEYTGIGAYRSSDGKIYCAQLFYRP